MYDSKSYIVNLCWNLINITNCKIVSQEKNLNVKIPIGTVVTGKIVDVSYNKSKEKYLESSFIARYKNYLSPRVLYLSKGVYEFKSFLNDVGTYNLEVRLDFQNSFGTCNCNTKNSVILFQNIANTSVHVVPNPNYFIKRPVELPNACRWLVMNSTFNCVPYFEKWDWIRLPNKNYWIHIDGDSTLQRGEVQDFIFELNNRIKKNVKSQSVKCIDLETGKVKKRKEACGIIHSIGLRKLGNFINVFEFNMKNGKNILLSLASYTGTGKILNETQWNSLFKYIDKHRKPDTVILNYALHFSHKYTCQNNKYSNHVKKIFLNIRKVYQGNILWHPGLSTQFENLPPYGEVYESVAPKPWPLGSHIVNPKWKCRTNHRMYLMRDYVSSVSKKFNITLLKDTLDISSVMFRDTIDNRHYDGGIYNKLKQRTSINVLNYVLQNL